MAKVVVVIPTYNERENTEKMIDVLAEIFAKIKDHEMALLYVDDTSPDKTYEVVREKMKKYKWLHLLLNAEKKGLGVAYMKGFSYAINELKADYIMEFDSDFQHNPEDIPRLVAQINNGYDFIVGSRYVKGGSIPQEWGFDRKLLSVIGNLVARVLLILPQAHDVTGGFRLSKVKGFMDKFPFDKIVSRSFAYKIHTFFYMMQSGAKLKEVPIHFLSRTAGESKIAGNEMKETLRVIFVLQWHNPKLRRFFKFGVVGFIGYLVNAIFLSIFSRANFPEWAAWAASTELAIISNFTLNNIWTFKEEKIVGLGRVVKKFIQFNGTSLGALLIQTVAGTIGVAIFGSQYRQLLLPFIVVFLVLPYNYLSYNIFIWKTWKIPMLSKIQKFLG